MDKDWAMIYSSSQSFLVEMLQHLLKNENIESIILNHNDSMYKFGDIELYVHRDNVIKTKLLMDKNQIN